MFKRVTFSRYDDVYCHEFVAEDGMVKIWFLLPDEQPADWMKYFKRIELDRFQEGQGVTC